MLSELALSYPTEYNKCIGDANFCCLTKTTDVVTIAGMTLGKNLKALREQKELSQEALASRAGLGDNGQQIIAAIENRGSKSSRYAPALANALEVPLEKLLGLPAASHGLAVAKGGSEVPIPTKEQLGELNWLFMKMLPEFRKTLLIAARKNAQESDKQIQQGAG